MKSILALALAETNQIEGVELANTFFVETMMWTDMNFLLVVCKIG